jgi:hypothetical protein
MLKEFIMVLLGQKLRYVNTGRSSSGGAGTLTAGLFLVAEHPTAVADNESWNGTTWTESTDLNTARWSSWRKWNFYSCLYQVAGST